MANTRKITDRGHTVKGALAAYLVPRLAVDGALKPGELDTLLKGVSPAPYKEQVPVISASVRETFKDRFATDSKADDLEELLEAIEEEGGDDEEEELDDAKPKVVKDDDEEMVEDGPGTELMAVLAKCNIPPDELERINELINAPGKGKGEDTVKDQFPPNNSVKKDVDKEGGPVTKQAMDSAIASATKATREQLGALYAAAEAVAPTLGRIDTLAFDSADAIYGKALEVLDVKTEGVPPAAFKSLYQLAVDRAPSPAQSHLATDEATGSEDFSKRYTHIPALA